MTSSRRQGRGVVDRPLAFGAGLLSLLLVAGALNAFTTIAQWRDAQELERSRDALGALQDFTSNLAEARAALRRRLKDGSVDDLRAFEERARRAGSNLDEFERVGDRDRRESLAKLRRDFLALEADWTRSLQSLEAKAGRSSISWQREDAEGVRLLQVAYAQVDEMRAAERRLIARREAALRRAYLISLWTGILSCAVGIGMAALYILAARRHAREMERAAERLRELSDALRLIDRRKDVFLATLAHELRSPLAPIRSASEILSRGGVNDEAQAKRLAAMLDRQVSHMATLVNDLLDIARITQGKLALRRELAPLSRVLDTALEASAPAMEAKGQRFEARRPEPDPVIDVDPVRLSQVLTNLLNNAARYSEPGSWARLDVEISGADLTISVSDGGLGIPSDARERIFDMFEQLAPGSASQGGLGIGLALAKAIVELHGGTIEARSEGRGKGSEFVIELPGVVRGARAAGAAGEP